MEFILFLGLVVMFIIFISNSSKNNSGIRMLTESIGLLLMDVRELRKEIQSIKNLVNQGEPRQKANVDVLDWREQIKAIKTKLTKEEISPKVEAVQSPLPEPSKELPILKQEIEPAVQPSPTPVEPVPVPEPPTPEPEIQNLVTEEPFKMASPITEKVEIPAANPVQPATAPPETPPAREQLHGESFQFKESKNMDLEKFIGENLINKIGIGVLFLGIAFFVKYAIDQNWINETGRVCIGMGCGAILLGLAHYLRHSYRSFSSVLAGGGIAVFYATIAFAFHQYHLMSQTVAFVIMVAITAFTVSLALIYNKLELAIIAAVGGFITPFLVSNGEGNYIALFTYLVILNIGLLALAYYKRWPSLNVIALFFTEIIYGGWLTNVLTNSKPISYPTALMFASVFYLIFMGMNMIYQVKNKEKFVAFDFFIILFINCTYYAAGMLLLNYWNNGDYHGIFTFSLGLANLALALMVYKIGKPDRNLLFLLIGLTVSFFTLTIPIQLHGHSITMFWCLEFVLLYWFSEYSGIKIFRYSSIVICGLALISLFVDWNNATPASGRYISLIFNGINGIVTNIIAIAAFTASFVLISRSKSLEFLPGLSNQSAAIASLVMAIALLFITCIFGVNLYFESLHSYDIPNVYHTLILELFAFLFVLAARKYPQKVSVWLLPAVYILCFLVSMGSLDLVTQLRDNVLFGKYNATHLYLHWADAILLAVIFYLSIQEIRKRPLEFGSSVNSIIVVTGILIIIFLSTEFSHIYIASAYHNHNIDLLVSQYQRAGLTVVWAISSFAMMWLGMKHGQKPMRIFSLVLFGIILFKLFIIDLSDISEGGKILAFILLGVLLLIVSFMYQKLKKILIDGKKE